MTIEQEARECVSHDMESVLLSQWGKHEGLDQLRYNIAKALKAKQDRIDELDKKLELEKEELNRWQDSTCRLEGKLDKALARIDELEGALREIANMVDGEMDIDDNGLPNKAMRIITEVEEALGGGV